MSQQILLRLITLKFHHFHVVKNRLCTELVYLMLLNRCVLSVVTKLPAKFGPTEVNIVEENPVLQSLPTNYNRKKWKETQGKRRRRGKVREVRDSTRFIREEFLSAMLEFEEMSL